MESKMNVINGVDLNRLQQTIEAVNNDPQLATFRFKINNTWIDCGYNQSEIKDFYGTSKTIEREEPFLLSADEPHVLLGQDTAPNPVEFVLHALASCLTTSMVYHAAARGYEVDSVSSNLEGELDLRGFLGIDPSVRKGYKNINVNFLVEGNLSEEQKQDMIELTQFSPVFDIISNSVPVQINVEVRSKEVEIDC